MTFDFDRGVVVLFGGWDGPSPGSRTYSNDVWEWNGQDWRRRTTRISPAARANADIVSDPTSRTIILTAAGMPGCSLLVDPVCASAATSVTGSSQTSLPIPNDPVLLGRTLYAQGFAGDPGVNQLGLVASNGASGTIGGK